ncbi:MAG: beta-mannosidase [Propionibacteriaceae bacterium]|jgi:beta-mannosidase|nr:beta-mannosidase [Propionibacteriaceae bacterium]
MTTSTHATHPLADFDIYGCAPGTGDPAALATDTTGEWTPALVPGGVRDSLLAAGKIDHPFYGANEHASDWVNEQEWWYRTTFPAPERADGARVRLVCLGLDTIADLWLNGQALGHHENQFCPAVFDIADLLTDSNTLLVRFTPPMLNRDMPAAALRMMAAMAQAFAALMPEPGSLEEMGGHMSLFPRATSLRKAAFSWGWDFGPNLPNIGIWRPVELSVEPGPVIAGHHVALTALTNDHGRAEVLVKVETDTTGPLKARATLTAPSGRIHTADIDIADGTGQTTLAIDEPELWWTHDLGGQPLYDVHIDLLAPDGTKTDTVTDRIGLRLLTLDRSPDIDGEGNYFRFILNHVPLFCRGANWLPASVFTGATSPETYAARVRQARDGNLIMLRVWGGGVYEQDAFYGACDEQGVLVWQDFMFACTDYPSADPALQNEVAREAEYQVRRLRNRACLALWSGNNEVQVMHLATGQGLEEGDWGWHFFYQILPAAVERWDGLTPFWPGSPYGEPAPQEVFGMLDGDRHTWEVWHGDILGPTREWPTKGDERHYRRYAEDTSKFVSEFGIHASPELATLRRWIPEAELAVHSPTFDLHNKDNPKNKGDELLAVTTGLPTTLGEYVDYTQAVQAEGMAFAIAHYRRRQPHTAGALVWQFNDVWPGISWSILDYDGVPKAAYYAMKRVCAPVAVSFAAGADGRVELWLSNNTTQVVEVPVQVEVGTFGGTERASLCTIGRAEPSQSALIWQGPMLQDVHHYAWASSPNGQFPSARLYAAEIAQLQFGPSSLEVTPEAGGLRIRSHGHSYGVRVAQPHPGITLSDNWFDLRDGDEAFVSVSGADPATLRVTMHGSAE